MDIICRKLICNNYRLFRLVGLQLGKCKKSLIHESFSSKFIKVMKINYATNIPLSWIHLWMGRDMVDLQRDAANLTYILRRVPASDY